MARVIAGRAQAFAPPRLGGLWRHPDFLRLWAAQTISQLGTQVTFVALPLAAILALHASTPLVALLGTVQFLPFVLFALPAGVWVDRVRRRPILVVADGARAAALLSIPAAWAAGVLSLPQLYAVAFVVGSFTVFFDVAYQSFLPSLVERGQLVEGNAKLEISRAGAQVTGPGIAGWLVGAVSAPVAILADAVSYLCSALLLLRIRRREGPAPETPVAELARRGLKHELAEGLRYVLGHRLLRPIATCTAASNLFGAVVYSLLVVYAVRRLHLRPAEIGLVFALGNAGFLLGAALAGQISARLGVGRTIALSAIVSGPPLLLVPLAPPRSPLPFLVAAQAIASAGAVVYNVAQVSLRQQITPERMLGRMNAVMRFVVWGTLPLGSALGSGLAASVGLRTAIAVGAVGSAVTFLPVVLSSVRDAR